MRHCKQHIGQHGIVTRYAASVTPIPIRTSAAGHINSDSQLGIWPQGLGLLAALRQ